MAEKNSDHLISIEKDKLTCENNQVQKGQLFAFIIILVILALCFYTVHSGYPYIAAVLVGLNLVSLVSAFIYGRRKK